MIVEYSYDVLKTVIELFQQSQIVTLDIEDIDGRAIIDYTVIEDYLESERYKISATLRNSLGSRLYVNNSLNQYAEKKVMNQVVKFTMSFTAYGVEQCKFEKEQQFTGKPVSQKETVDNLGRALEIIDRTIIDMGVSEQQTTFYKREGSGKSKKYVALTIQQVADKLRTELYK